MTLVQFEAFAILAPTLLNTPTLARQFTQIMDDEGVTLADLLQGLAEERTKSSNLGFDSRRTNCLICDG